MEEYTNEQLHEDLRYVLDNNPLLSKAASQHSDPERFIAESAMASMRKDPILKRVGVLHDKLVASPEGKKALEELDKTWVKMKDSDLIPVITRSDARRNLEVYGAYMRRRLFALYKLARELKLA